MDSLDLLDHGASRVHLAGPELQELLVSGVDLGQVSLDHKEHLDLLAPPDSLEPMSV